MTVHCVEIMCSTDVDVQNVKNKISDLKSKYGEKIPSEEVSFKKDKTLEKEVTYYRALFRVSLTESSKTTEKDDLTEQIRKEMDKSASWWQVAWHECNHDSDSEDCPKKTQNDSGNVPSKVKW